MNERFRLSELERQLHALVRICEVIEQHPDGRVKVTDGELISDYLPRALVRAGENPNWHPLDIGEQVIVLCPSGDFSQGIVLASLYQDRHPPPSNDLDVELKRFSDGSEVSYDRKQHRLTVDLKGAGSDLAIKSSGTLNVDAAQAVSINTSANAAVTATGEIKVDANRIHLNGGLGCITAESKCQFSGNNHVDPSLRVFAGK